MRVWMLLAASIATVAATKSFGLEVDGDVLHEAQVERFDAWYGSAEGSLGAEEAIEEYVADFERLEEQLEDVSERCDTLPIHRWVVSEVKGVKPRKVGLKELALPDVDRVVPIEVYTPDSVYNAFNGFIEKLIWGEEVRIAFLGDSFIEGDILTSDLRESLQAKFGGGGVGFVHCDIPFTTARRTIKRTANGWSAYSVLKPKSNPQTINDNFFVSGYTARGGVGAKVSWQTTSVFDHLDDSSRARILVSSHEGGSVEVTINGDTTLCRRFDLAASPLPQEINIEVAVDKLDMKVVAGEVDCYGASIEGVGGVTLDNLSMRANSGHAIFGTSALVNRQIDTLWGYDLVVLQYGLNIMEAGKLNFSGYAKKLQQMIAYAQSSFPDAAILVLGVSDRWIKNEESGVYEPIGSVEAMTSYQRGAAEAAGVAFWPAADAMAKFGGMPQFVANNWAAKDHTHINFAGGAKVGGELYSSIVTYAYNHLASGEATAPRVVEQAKPIETNTTFDDVKPIVKPQESATTTKVPETVEQDVVPEVTTPVDSAPLEDAPATSIDEEIGAEETTPEKITPEEQIIEETTTEESTTEVQTAVEESTTEESSLLEGDAEVEIIDESEFFETTL